MHKHPLTISVIAVWNIYDCTRLKFVFSLFVVVVVVVNVICVGTTTRGRQSKGGKKERYTYCSIFSISNPKFDSFSQDSCSYSPDLHGHACKHTQRVSGVFVCVL